MSSYFNPLIGVKKDNHLQLEIKNMSSNRDHSLFSIGPVSKASLLIVIFAGLYYFMTGSTEYIDSSSTYEEETYTETQGGGSISSKNGANNYLPTSTTNQVIQHQYYTMSYSEEHEQPEWVAYELKQEQFQRKGVGRSDNFRPDPKVKTRSAYPSDYKRSGYDRGHLVPAGDMNFDKTAMSETFFMSNMSPQIRNFNGGIWRELEENTREWAKKYKHLYVVTGPVLTVNSIDEIGRNQVSVPRTYYKVLLDLTKPETKAIGFILDNKVSDKHLSNFAVTVDEVEALTGIDFFHELLSPEEEEALESQVDIGRWKFSEKRFRQRVKSWNKR